MYGGGRTDIYGGIRCGKRSEQNDAITMTITELTIQVKQTNVKVQFTIFL